MTHFEVLKQGENLLRECTEDYKFDVWCLFSDAFSIDKTKYFLKKDEEAPETEAKAFFEKLEERKNGRPLQYILGVWQFLDCDFYVGEGVLIPRQDTECLVLKAFEYIRKNDVKTVYDLCSGSGCIGICVAKEFPETDVVLFEKSDEAIKYIKKNIVLNGVKNVRIVKGDLFNGADCYSLNDADLILSNPPYIKTEDIVSLQKEVLFEPKEALDGGEDGLRFYKALRDEWFVKNKCGCIIMECGEDQAEDIAKMFSSVGYTGFITDMNGILRDVIVLKRR